MTEETKERILQAAIREFSEGGFDGARMEGIAREAGVNKAMLFYYFSSKKELYKTVIVQAIGALLSEMRNAFADGATPEKLIENIPRVYISFLSSHPYVVKIVGRELTHRPEHIQELLGELVEKSGIGGFKHFLFETFRGWVERGLVREESPEHFMINIISLSLFSFIALPMIEIMAGKEVTRDERFFEKRLQSVVNVLKRGMLK